MCGEATVGRTPWSARVPLDPLIVRLSQPPHDSRRDDFVLLHFCFFARCDEFLSSLLQLAEDGYAGAIHGQNRSDRQSAVRRDLVAMGFGDFLNQAVGAQESKLAADRR